MAARRETAETPTNFVLPQVLFYKTFTRPVLKVFLTAIVAYQIAYLGWMKLEQDEIKAERTQEVAALEAKVAELQKQQAEKR